MGLDSDLDSNGIAAQGAVSRAAARWDIQAGGSAAAAAALAAPGVAHVSRHVSIDSRPAAGGLAQQACPKGDMPPTIGHEPSREAGSNGFRTTNMAVDGHGSGSAVLPAVCVPWWRKGQCQVQLLVLLLLSMANIAVSCSAHSITQLTHLPARWKAFSRMLSVQVAWMADAAALHLLP